MVPGVGSGRCGLSRREQVRAGTRALAEPSRAILLGSNSDIRRGLEGAEAVRVCLSSVAPPVFLETRLRGQLSDDLSSK